MRILANANFSRNQKYHKMRTLCMYFYSHFLLLQYHVNIRTICIYLVACCILMFDVSSQEWPRAMGPSIKKRRQLREEGRAQCFVEGLYIAISNWELAGNCKKWENPKVWTIWEGDFWNLEYLQPISKMYRDTTRFFVCQFTLLQVNNYEIIVKYFHISHNLTWYSASVHKFTRIYPVCSTYELTKQFM